MANPFRRFRVNSSMDAAADSFEAEAIGAELFVNAAETDRVTIRAGLLDADGYEIDVAVIENAVIDQYLLTVGLKDIFTTISGRDPMAAALDGRINRRYIRLPRSTVASQLDDPSATQTEEFEGKFKASDIARDLAGLVGLDLSWQCRDYELLVDFDATGRIYDALKTLVEPWSQVEPYKVDIWVQGGALVIKPRTLTTPPVDYTYSIHDARITGLTFGRRSSRFLKYGCIHLTGERKSANVVEQPDGTFAFDGNEREESITSSTFDDRGELIEQTITKNHYRMPERILVKTVKESFLHETFMTLVKKEVIEKQWEGTLFDKNGPVNNPVQLSETTVVSGRKEGDKTKTFWPMVQRIKTGFSYGDNKFMTGQSQVIEELNLKTGTLEKDTMVVRTIRPIATLQTEQITDTFKIKNKTKEWFLKQRDTQTQAGYPPGGPGRARPKTEKTDLGGESIPVRRDECFSTDLEAVDVSYDNPNMTEVDLDFIMSQFSTANGKWEHSISWTAMPMPWVRRTIVVQFIGLLDADGYDIPLGPVLIHDYTLSYDESSRKPGVVADVTGVYWADL